MRVSLLENKAELQLVEIAILVGQFQSDRAFFLCLELTDALHQKLATESPFIISWAAARWRYSRCLQETTILAYNQGGYVEHKDTKDFMKNKFYLLSSLE